MATTALNYDIDARKFSSTQFGLGYIDDCFIFAMNYITGYTYSTLPNIAPVLDHRVMLTIALRTIGATGTTQSLGSTTGLFGTGN